MEKSSLEEEDSPLLERWAMLLATSGRDPSQAKTIYTDILSRLTPDEVDVLDSLIATDLLQNTSNAESMGLDRSIVLDMKEAERSFHEFLRIRLNKITEASNARHYRDQLKEFANGLIARTIQPFVENVTIRFDGETSSIHRYSQYLKTPSALDVLTSCGLIHRYEIKISLVLAEAYVAMIFPTLLGVKFVVACRGDVLKGRSSESTATPTTASPRDRA
jgi:hypothetical protein